MFEHVLVMFLLKLGINESRAKRAKNKGENKRLGHNTSGY